MTKKIKDIKIIKNRMSKFKDERYKKTILIMIEKKHFRIFKL
jgi:hypothetical protein